MAGQMQVDGRLFTGAVDYPYAYAHGTPSASLVRS